MPSYLAQQRQPCLTIQSSRCSPLLAVVLYPHSLTLRPLNMQQPDAGGQRQHVFTVVNSAEDPRLGHLAQVARHHGTHIDVLEQKPFKLCVKSKVGALLGVLEQRWAVWAAQ